MADAIDDPIGDDSISDHRPFLHDGVEWLVSVAGRGRTGRGRDDGSTTMDLHFRPAEASDAPPTRAIAVGRSLEALSELEITRLLAVARPVPDPVDAALSVRTERRDRLRRGRDR